MPECHSSWPSTPATRLLGAGPSSSDFGPLPVKSNNTIRVPGPVKSKGVPGTRLFSSYSYDSNVGIFADRKSSGLYSSTSLGMPSSVVLGTRSFSSISKRDENVSKLLGKQLFRRVPFLLSLGGRECSHPNIHNELMNGYEYNVVKRELIQHDDQY